MHRNQRCLAKFIWDSFLLLFLIYIFISVAATAAHLPAESLYNVPTIKTIAYASDTTSAILQSSDGNYQWKFIKYNATSSAGVAAQERRLLVVINTQFNTTVVWIANRNRPVSPKATLSVDVQNSTANGARIILSDTAPQPSAVAWSTPYGVHSLQMNNSGNLVAWDAFGNLMWQSFDEAADILVPGQFIRAGHNVTAYLAPNNVTAGHYSLNIEIGGAVLYASFDEQQNKVPYQILSYAKGLDLGTGSITVNDILESPCNQTMMVYNTDGSGVFLHQLAQSANGSLHDMLTPECQANDTQTIDGLSFDTRMAGDGFRFLRIMPTGDANAFLLDSGGLHLDNELFKGFFSTYCRLPSYCGVNSICSSVNTCTCPTQFSPIDASDPTKGCRLDTPLNCSIADQHEFLAVVGVNYYANVYFTPHIVDGPTACTALCLPNCSCTTALYDNQTKECFLYDTVQTLRSGGSSSMTAYLRVSELPPSAATSSGTPLSRRAIAGIAVGAAILVVGFLLLGGWVGRRYMKSAQDDESEDEEAAFLESLPGLPPRYSYKELEIATDGFSRKLGKGGSGAVFEGEIDPRPARQRPKQISNFLNISKEVELIKVAVKELEVTDRPSLASASRKQFRTEVATLGSLSHINLVQLKGFCAEGTHRLLIYEFLENSSLDRWIFATDPNEVLPWEKRYGIAVDTARGLAFLHEGSRDMVLHLDVKPQNILLDGDFRAKLADFGLAKLMDRGAGENQTVTAVRGTPGYMAPEWFLNLPITDKSDVFSYGMVLLELVGGRKNVNLELDSDAHEWYFPAWAIKQAENGHMADIIDKRLMSAQDEVAIKECESNMSRLIQVAFWCLQESASSRPSMSTILLMLEKHVETPCPPLNLTYVLRRQATSPPPALFQEVSSSFSRTTNGMNASGIMDVISELEAR